MSLRHHIASQFPSLFLTLVSILIGIFFADLVAQAQARMTLWPLDLRALRVWGQIAGMAASALTVWAILTHVGIARRHIPGMADAVIVFLAPVPLLIGNSFVGREAAWPWFYFASLYLVVAIFTTRWQTRLTIADPELRAFRILDSPFGHLAVVYAGVPFYAAAGWAGQHGLLSRLADVILAWSSVPAAFLCTWLFFRDWKTAIAATEQGQ
jgi:hypothetical protein